jgi:hypothetical protein
MGGVKLLHRGTPVYSILRADVLETEHFRMCLNAVEYIKERFEEQRCSRNHVIQLQCLPSLHAESAVRR